MRAETDERALTDLSLKYGVLGRTTSFVAVLLKEHADRKGGRPERIEIPVALPHGWQMEQGWSAAAPTRAAGAVTRGLNFRNQDTITYCALVLILNRYG